MEKKINVAELLKDCPQGMELDCTLFENLKFDYIKEDTDFPIKCFIENESSPVSFNKYGKFNTHNKAKCVIFPKGKTTWEGFQNPIENNKIEDSIIDIVKENDNRFRIVLNYQFDMEVDEGEYYAVRRPQLLSIWHDIDEEPIYVNGVTPIIIDSNYGHISQEGHHYNQVEWKSHIEFQKHCEFKWAYEKDLMNL